MWERSIHDVEDTKRTCAEGVSIINDDIGEFSLLCSCVFHTVKKIIMHEMNGWLSSQTEQEPNTGNFSIFPVGNNNNNRPRFQLNR